MKNNITPRQLVASRRPQQRSFTIIELIVVIGIILLLVGLTVSVSVILHQKSEVRQVENTLKLLDMALQEWELAAERQLTWGPEGLVVSGQPMHFDINSNPNPPSGKTAAFQMKQVLKRLSDTPSSREILSRIDPKLFLEEKDPDDSDPDARRFVLRDPWGQTIVPVHPGRLPSSQIPDDAILGICDRDADGTIRTRASANTSADVNEMRLGICENRRMFFISRGPDGELGDQQLNKQLTDAGIDNKKLKQTEDNLYSYPPLVTRCP